jgi:hypothetical protein
MTKVDDDEDAAIAMSIATPISFSLELLEQHAHEVDPDVTFIQADVIKTSHDMLLLYILWHQRH